MADNRKSIKVPPAVKAEIDAIRKELGAKTEAHVLAYLGAMYRDQKTKKITLADHQEYVKRAEEMNDQASL